MTEKPLYIFYSWQSDLPNKTNRAFIGTALEKAAKSIKSDSSIEVDPVIDRDTNGASGSPDISDTIFSKIDKAGIYVCDVSIINKVESGRRSPNPNVLIELGYAAKSLSWDKILLVCNTAFGKIEELPFEIRGRRIISYHSPEHTEDRASERKKLENSLRSAVSQICQTKQQQSSNFQVTHQNRVTELSMPLSSPAQGIWQLVHVRVMFDEANSYTVQGQDFSLHDDEGTTYTINDFETSKYNTHMSMSKLVFDKFPSGIPASFGLLFDVNPDSKQLRLRCDRINEEIKLQP